MFECACSLLGPENKKPVQQVDKITDVVNAILVMLTMFVFV